MSDRLTALIGELRRSTAGEPTADRTTVLALLDVAEAAAAMVSGQVMGSVHGRAGRDATYCDSCQRSWPCEGATLAAALGRLRESAPMRELRASLDAEGWRREHDRLHARIAELEDGIREHRRLMTESYMLPPRQWERDTRQYDLNLWGHVGEGQDR